MSQLALLDTSSDQRPRRPPEPIVRAADVEGQCRWSLSRRWAPGPLLACVGNNPSYADAKRDDPTMWRVMTFAWRWGYGGVVMLNVYPFITPSMKVLRAWRASDLPAVDIALGENISHAAKALQLADLHVACWGNLPDPSDVAMFIEGVTLVLGSEPQWHCLGKTASGAPTHPMARGKHRVPDDTQPTRWSP